METEEVNIPKKYAPNKKGAVVKEIWGEKKRRELNTNISSLALPPITRKTVAKYRVISNGDEINPATGKPADIQPIYLPGSYLFHDKFDPDFTNRDKMVYNKTGRKEQIKHKDGTNTMEDVLDPVEFHDGVKTVNVEAQYNLYLFLELHPLNKSNKLRPKDISPAFERIDLINTKTEAFMLAEQELQEEAIIEVRAITNIDEIIGRAVSAGIQTVEDGKPRSTALIKSDLRDYAWRNPRGFFGLSKNTKHAIQMAVLEADSFGIIDYEHDKKRWVSTYTDEPLHTVLAGTDPVADFVNHLHKPENIDMYEAIRNQLDYWNR